MKEVEVILATKKAAAAYDSLEAANQAVIECQSDNETAIQYYEKKMQKLQKQMFWGFLIVSAVYAAALTAAFMIIA